MVETDVQTAKHQQQRSNRFAHIIVDRGTGAVHVFPPGDQIIRTVASDLLVKDLAQMDLERFGDKLRDRRSRSAQLVIVVHRRGGGIGADHAGIGARGNIVILTAGHTAHEAGESLIGLWELLGVGVLTFVAKQVPAGEAAAIGAVDGVSVAVAPLE
jgi:hypothetical protein